MSRSYELRLEQVLDAPVDRVWKAITEGAEIARWYGPGDGFRVEVLAWDCKVGGEYKVAMKSPDGNTHTVLGSFRKLDPPRVLAYSWAWEGGSQMNTLVTFALEPHGGKTRLTLTHEGFPDEGIRDNHQGGWVGSMERLVLALA